MPFSTEEKFIQQAEQKLGVIFPKSYRESMIRSNGGEIATVDDDWQLYPIFDDSDRTRLKRSCNDVVRETSTARQWTGFPERGIAIGTNGEGDVLVFLPIDSDPKQLDCKLYVWNHEDRGVQVITDDFSQVDKI
jgi:hypothetical protein